MRQSCPSEVRDPCLRQDPCMRGDPCLRDPCVRDPITPCMPRCAVGPPSNSSVCTTVLGPPPPPAQSITSSICFPDLPMACEKNTRSGRYKTVRPTTHTRRGDEDIFVETYEIHDPTKQQQQPPIDANRHYSLTSKHYPLLYENFDKLKLHNECEILPNDRVYEIRKEKILIRTDKNSASPPRMRSKSSDKYLDTKNVRILVNEPHNDGCYEDYDGTLSKRGLSSRSGYYISGAQLTKNATIDCAENLLSYGTQDRDRDRTDRDKDRERDRSHRCYDEYGKRSHDLSAKHHHRSKYRYAIEDFENICDDYHAIRKRASGDLKDLSSMSKHNISNCPQDIVYVPMVKEHFIQRESAKLGGMATLSNPELDNLNSGS